MEGEMNVKKIVKEYLEKNGFDGLYTPGECSCKLEDLIQCDMCGLEECMPGYLQPGDEDYDFFIGKDKDHRQPE